MLPTTLNTEELNTLEILKIPYIRDCILPLALENVFFSCLTLTALGDLR
jgi:hypothetical protein